MSKCLTGPTDFKGPKPTMDRLKLESVPQLEACKQQQRLCHSWWLVTAVPGPYQGLVQGGLGLEGSGPQESPLLRAGGYPGVLPWRVVCILGLNVQCVKLHNRSPRELLNTSELASYPALMLLYGTIAYHTGIELPAQNVYKPTHAHCVDASFILDSPTTITQNEVKRSTGTCLCTA